VKPKSRKRGGKKPVLHKPTRFNNVSFYESKTKRHDGKPDKCFFIRYMHQGKQVREKIGWASEKYTAQDAHQIYAERLRTIRHGAELPRKKKSLRLQEIFDKYIEDRGFTLKGARQDRSRWKNHLENPLGKKTVEQLTPLGIDRVRIKLQKDGAASRSIYNTLGLLRRIINYGAELRLCPPLPFKMKIPTHSPEKTEILSPEEWERLMEVLDGYEKQADANMVRVAMFTGLRRSEIFKLKWDDLDFRNRIIHVRDPKPGEDEVTFMNELAIEALENQKKFRKDSPYVFPGRGGKQRVYTRVGRIIRDKAELPKDFRPFHGLRHAFASRLAESGKVDMYHLQKLLRHRDPRMTQRYAHLRDESLQRASDVLTKELKKEG
jgi:integrase